MEVGSASLSNSRSEEFLNVPLEVSALSTSTSLPLISPRGSIGYQPTCFSKDSFNRSDFKVDAFISDCKSRVPLESVLNDLKDYSNSLDNELLELINKDYADFVNLSSNLVGIDRILNDLRRPLQNIKEEITVSHIYLYLI